jgi:hypothetical protein
LIVARHVPIELRLPENCVSLRIGAILAPLMTMPEAAVNENNHSTLRQYDVRFTWKVFAVKAEAKARLMDN